MEAVGRRALIVGAIGMLATMSRSAAAYVGHAGISGEKRLAVHNVNTGERFDARFMRGGALDPGGLAELNHALRDWRNGQSHAIDPHLLLLVTSLRDRLGVPSRTPIDLISGYRSPTTNAARHAHDHAVASNSQHVVGRAMDMRMPGTSLGRLQAAALDAQAGGVGFYPRDGFVHVDTGAVRRWAG